jgi:hypothetical protein
MAAEQKINKHALQLFIERELEKQKALVNLLQNTEDAEKTKFIYLGYEAAMNQILDLIKPLEERFK